MLSQATSLYNKREPEAEGDLVDAERLLQRLLAKLLRFCCITRQTPEVRTSRPLKSQYPAVRLRVTPERLLAQLLCFGCITRWILEGAQKQGPEPRMGCVHGST